MTQPSYRIVREAAVVRLAGDFDINARDEMRAALLDAVRAGPAEVVVDFAEAAFLDSEAMGVLNAGRARG